MYNSFLSSKSTGKHYILILFLFTYLFTTYSHIVQSIESNKQFCEVYGEIVRVIDGDTVDFIANEIYSSRYLSLFGKEIRVRLADINAPELDTSEGQVSRDILRNLLNNYSWRACLDIDDYGEPTDRYGRYISVVFIKYNETHWLNVNKWLLDNKYAEIMDFKDNEFSPNKWYTYVEIVYTTPIASSSFNSSRNNWFEKLLPNPLFISITIIIISLVFITMYKYRYSRRDSY